MMHFLYVNRNGCQWLNESISFVTDEHCCSTLTNPLQFLTSNQTFQQKYSKVKPVYNSHPWEMAK